MPSSEWRAQIIRYGVSGGFLVLCYSAIYWGAARALAIPPLVANSIAFGVTLVMGWAIHSRWSFRGHGARDRVILAYWRFFAVNLGGYALNSFWVWVIVERMHGSVTVSLIPIVFVTPWLSFWANRQWTFA